MGSICLEMEAGVQTFTVFESSKPGDFAAGANIASLVEGRDAGCWAAYGRFVFASVRTRCSHLVNPVNDRLLQFRRRTWGFDGAMVYAYQQCDCEGAPIWTTAVKALKSIADTSRVDHLNLYLAGTVPPEDADGKSLHPVMNGRYIALAMPYETRDIINLPESFEEFLKGLGNSNRRHMKARHKEAVEGGLQFEISSDPRALGAEERYALGLNSRPTPYERDLVDAFDVYAMGQPRFYHASLRSASGELLSYTCGFLKADSAVMMYQFNHQDYPKLSLSMTMRAFLIKHWVGTEIKRILFPMGLGGHLAHAATTNPIAQIFFLRRSIPAVAKALLMRMMAPTSDAALMVGTKGFLRAVLLGR
jgi:hypothetical protein